jgi:glycosyltransferase involved in cell wall biosynthesis
MPASAGSGTRRSARSGRRALILVEDLPVPFDRRVWSEAQTLRDAGWRVTIVCPRGEGARRWHERIDRIEIFRYPLPTTAAGLFSHVLEYAVAVPATLLLSLLAWRGRRFDVVHLCNPPDFLFPIGMLFRALGAAIVFDQHDLAPEVYVAQGGRNGGAVHRFLGWCERSTYRLADAVIATNESYRRFALTRGKVASGRLFVVRSAPDPRRIFRVDADGTLKLGRPYLVVYLGTMGPQDGVDLFVSAARSILDERPGQVRFLAIGGGNQLEAVRAQAAGLGLSDEDLSFSGRIPDEQVRVALSTADLAISPDPANEFNEYCTMNKTLEYMAVGLPVVAFDLEETRVSAAKAAEYAEPNDPIGLARIAIRLLDEPEKRARMAAVGRQRIAGPLSWERSAESLLAAYQMALETRGAR